MLTRLMARGKRITLHRRRGLHALLRDVQVCRPEQRVEDEAAEGFEVPVGMEVAFGEGEAAAAVLALEGPGDDGLVAASAIEGEEVHAAGVVGAEADAPVVFS